jgi:ActR/RegA family two-component response regulator
MLRDTRNLALFCVNHTVFARGYLNAAALQLTRFYTIFCRTDRQDTPYLLRELAHDLRMRAVERGTISEEIEQQIRSFAAHKECPPESPEPVIVEDGYGSCYLILDGNKRLTALALNDMLRRKERLRVWMGHSGLPWASLLSCYEMRPAVTDDPVVLVVDDNEAALDGLTELLRGAGLPVVACQTFEAARVFASRNPVGTLLTDVRLGDHNGLQLIHLVHSQHPNARLVAFSGYDDPVVKRDAEAFGASYLSKPLDLSALFALLSDQGSSFESGISRLGVALI